ncbi:MAG: TetR/AcrR family transcriptional regulator [Anaerolineales bacterium]
MNSENENLSRWDRRKERTRRRLLEAADAHLLEKDFDETTVEEIAEAADVAKGTFFNYFESKETLLVALISTRIEVALEELPGAGRPATERIRLTLEKVAQALKPYRHLTSHLLGQNLSRHQPPPHNLVDRIVELIEEGQEQGLFRPDVEVNIAAMFITLHFFRVCLLQICGMESALSWDQHLEQGMNVIYYGLIKGSPKRTPNLTQNRQERKGISSRR